MLTPARVAFPLRWIERSSLLVEGVAVLLLYGYCVLMLAEVFSRGFLGSSLPFSWEYSTFAMAGVLFLGLGRALRAGTHVRVSLLAEPLSPRLRHWLELAVVLFATILALVICHALWTLVSNSLSRGTRAPSVMATPMAFPQMFALIGAAQLVLELIARGLRLLTGDALELPRESLLTGEPTTRAP